LWRAHYFLGALYCENSTAADENNLGMLAIVMPHHERDVIDIDPNCFVVLVGASDPLSHD
jgi:hypothetical protein